MSEHVREQLSPFLDGELAPPQRTAVEEHLGSCGECAALLEDLAVVDALARDLPVPAPAGGFEAFPARVRARLASRPGRRRALPAWGWAAAAALLLAVITPLTLLERGKEASSSAPARQEIPSTADMPVPAAPAAGPLPPPTTVASLSDAKERQIENRPGARKPQDRRWQADEAKASVRRNEYATAEAGASSSGGTGGGVAAGREPARQRRPPVVLPQQRDTFAGAPEEMTAAASPPLPPATAQKKKDEAEADTRALGYTSAPAAAAPAPESARLAEELAREQERARLGAETADAEKRPAAPPAGASDKSAGGAAANRAKAGGDPGRSARFDGARQYRAEPRFASAAEARTAREAWRAQVKRQPEGAEADAARVLTIEAGLAAWELGREERDRLMLQRDIAAYLERGDAAQAERVRAVRRRLEPR
jgi:anti-sigma factor RsiW